MVTNQDTGSNTGLQPSLYIFTPRFFSVMYVDGTGPRRPRSFRSETELGASDLWDGPTD